jgi:hypothetical protein
MLRICSGRTINTTNINFAGEKSANCGVQYATRSIWSFLDINQEIQSFTILIQSLMKSVLERFWWLHQKSRSSQDHPRVSSQKVVLCLHKKLCHDFGRIPINLEWGVTLPCVSMVQS